PTRATDCGDALLDTLRLPVSGPVTVGVYVTVIVQLVCGANSAPQLFVCLKSPVVAIPDPENVSAPVPVLLRNTSCGPLVVVIACGWKLSAAGAMLPIGAVPAPLKATVCVPLNALSEIVTVPTSLPVTVGV